MSIMPTPADFQQVAQDLSWLSPKGHVVLGVDIHPVIRDNPVAPLDQFQACLALPDTGIPLNQDPIP